MKKNKTEENKSEQGKKLYSDEEIDRIVVRRMQGMSFEDLKDKLIFKIDEVRDELESRKEDIEGLLSEVDDIANR